MPFEMEPWETQKRPIWAGWYKRDGMPMESMEDFKLISNRDYKVVKQERLWNGARVSTVWLGLDHSFGDGPPLIFESMAFWGSTNGLLCERYTTMDEAIAGHIAMRNHCRTWGWTWRNWRPALAQALRDWWRPGFTERLGQRYDPIEDAIGHWPYVTRNRLQIWLEELKVSYGWPWEYTA